jgi:hypothetical protein
MQEDMNYDKILRRYDEQGAYEFPSGFPADSFEREAAEACSTLEKQLGRKLKFEGPLFCQDASFGAQCVLHEQPIKDNLIHQSCVRFSKFGRLVSITDTSVIDPIELDKIIQTMASLDYTYIPADILDKPYDGVMAGVTALPTWWIRYFDWL